MVNQITNNIFYLAIYRLAAYVGRCLAWLRTTNVQFLLLEN